ncbi:MAG: 2-oxo acid dehydrogenase subunit E2 [Verrucomicrobiales bacterium]|nr:2-oxo acid dehydrogenase subunit E2 [Verrucomicrobiales bacterium]
MPAYITMPKLSDTMSEGTLLKWLIKEGDTVSVGDEIAEVETDKATMTMTSFEEGVVHKLYAAEGDSTGIGSTLALVLEDGEDPPENADEPPAAPETAPAEADSSSAEDQSSEPEESSTDAKSAPAKSETGSPVSISNAGAPLPSAESPSGERIKASPLARRLAEEHGMNIGSVRGSGPGGRIVKDDILLASAGGNSGGGGGGIGLLPNTPARSDEEISLSGMRRVIAERLLESKTTIPHFYLNVQLNAEPMMALRSQVNEASTENSGPKYTVNDFIMRASVLAATAVPEVNASFQGDSILQYGEVHLSVAVAVDDGLVTPVIRSAQSKSIRQLSAEIKDLAGRARDKKLTPEEMQGGTFTISNLGSYGVDNFDAIINPPQAMILSIGTISRQPVVNDAGQIVPGMKMWIGMSCDHRVIDGAVGAQYLAEMKRLLENPVLLVV